jgi:hypothetical protein
MSRIWFSRGLRGRIARHIQADLQRAGFVSGAPDRFVDGDFGGHTETALRAFQARHGLAVHGAVDVETWGALTPEPLPTLFERCLAITADFEGHGYGKLQGNFDGAGLTWGIIGYTLEHGGIQAVLAAAEGRDRGLLQRCLGPLAATWRAVVARPIAEQLAWADSISSGPSKSRVPPPWRAAFDRLGNEPAVQWQQMQRAYDQYFVPCVRSGWALGLRSELGFALAFDVQVQNGRFKPAAFDRAASLPADAPELERRRVLANAVADSANPRWAEDVRRRKLALAEGAGRVHGRDYRFQAWGMDGSVPAA